MRVPWVAALLVATGITVAGCDSAEQQERACEKRLGPTEIHVRALPIEYATDLTQPESELSRMVGPQAGRIVSGLTHATLKSSVTYTSSGITNRQSHEHCLRPKIDVELAFAPMTVYVSRDNPEGSCQFGVTMQHELQHVAVYKDFLAEAAGEMERELKEYYGNRVLYFGSEKEASRKIADETRDRLGPLIEAKMKTVLEAQLRLDTREEYDRLQRACPAA